MLKVILGAALLALGGCIAYVPVGSSIPETVSSPTCYAGVYICPGPTGPPGSQCSCPGIGAPSYGFTR